MAATKNYLALDLGAESGRAILGKCDGERIEIEELHRFVNPPVRVFDSLYWNVFHLFSEIKTGLRKAAPRQPVSLGVDTWGVDFALLDRDGEIIGDPHHYRDPRSHGMMAKAFETVPRQEIFESTGVQFTEINSLYQLLGMKGSAALDAARTLLMMPDLFHYWLSGEKLCEFSDATTTQFYDPRKQNWARELLGRFGLPTDIYPRVVQPGTMIGEMLPDIRRECGLGAASVVAPACHDTGSAVAAVPAQAGNWAFLSSGTWSLLGREMPRPFINEKVLARNFTNEGGACGTTRLLKNICGMWLLEECRREWEKGGSETSYAGILAAAEAADPFRSVIDVDDAAFVAPGGMPERIAAACRRWKQPAPETQGQFARCIFESLALKYRLVLEDLQAITGEAVAVLHVVGGGSRNDLLCQYAADASAIAVSAGPVEAAALGNILLQAMAAGQVGSPSEAREIVRRSAEVRRFEPRAGGGWEEAAGRLREMIQTP